MSQKSLKKYKIDRRTAEDIEELIRKTGSSYTPEWHFDNDDPDIGTTIGKIYARQMQENIRAVNHLPDVYQAEFVNLLDLTLERAVPAGAVVVFHLADSGVDGTQIPRGTHLVATDAGIGGDSASAPVFETDRSLYVTAARITDVFMTDREEGDIIPLAGDFEAPRLYPEEGAKSEQNAETEEGAEAEAMPEEAAEDETEEEETFWDKSLHPFILFGERGGIGRDALILRHPCVFDVEDDSIYVRFVEGSKLIERIAAGKIEFKWLSKRGLKPFDSVSIAEDGQTVKLIKHKPCGKTGPAEAGGRMSLVALESMEPQREAILIEDILLSSSGSPLPPDYVGDSSSEWNVREFLPFGDTLSVFAECYIGKTEYFDKPGAEVTLEFHLTYEEHLIGVTREVRETELKVVKKKERAVREEVVTEAFADEITIEYFNGIGWRRLVCDTEYRTLMAGEKPGQYTLKFVSPVDWAPTEAGAFRGRSLRLRLMNSDNCYMRPANHHYPVITGLKISYTYRNREVRPAHIHTLTGTRMIDMTDKSRQEKPYAVFSPGIYADDALYLGFDRKIENGPVGILFRLGTGAGQCEMKCRYEYSSRRGFRQMRVIDGTADFSRSGIVQFIPPSDFAPMTLEGRRRYWLRIVREEAEWEKEQQRTLPHIEEISINAMTVSNAVTGEEQDFYIDEVQPNMHFFLGAGNILDATVWVNERDALTGEEMRTLLAEHPDEVRVDYDLIGNITACYVLWQEVSQLPDGTIRQDLMHSTWQDRRCYRIDRLAGEIQFGDGIHVNIPRVTDDTAFRVTLRTCAGDAGNVPEDTVTTMEQDFMFIDSVTNPVRAYGGSNMESVQEALLRGADIIHSRGRMVSMGDYCRAALRFSGVIDKVKGITGKTIDGRENPAELTFVLLMKDYAEGSFSFHRVEADLKEYMLSACEITVAPHRLHIVEPIFVSVSVSVWTEIMRVDDSFEVQNQIQETLDTYLDPVYGGSDKDGSGWEIGVMPKRAQIMMQLAAIRNQAMIRKTSITATYTDNDGIHEIDYDDLVVNPFMVCMSGEHHVHILYNREKEYAAN